MEVKLVIDFEIDHIQLSIFNFFFVSSYGKYEFSIPNPEVGTLEQYDKLRKGYDVIINYYNDNREILSIISKDGKVKFIINSNFGNSIIEVPWVECKIAFKQAYHWKLYF